MTDTPRVGFNKLGGIVFVGGSLSLGLVLFIVLGGSCGAGEDAIERYVASIASGGEVTEAIGGSDARRLTEILGRSPTVSVSNFQAQAGTACFWVTVDDDGESLDARFLLTDQGDTMTVSQVSLTLSCTCPDRDPSMRCFLEP